MPDAIHSASWIWCTETPAQLNQYGLFRRWVDLPEGGPVRIHACADMRYWLYVNGVRAGFGPGRYNERFPQYDTHDVTPLVRPGRNLIALKVHSIGPVPAITSFMAHRAALIAAVEFPGGSVVTDATWRCLRESAYAADTARFSAHQSFIECFDARKAQIGWERPDFDDSAWGAAHPLPPDSLAPWGKLVPRPIPHLMLIPRLPARVLETGLSVPAPEADLRNMTTLPNAIEYARRSPADLVRQDPVGLFPLSFSAPADARSAAYAVIDFAENSAGYLTFRLEGDPGTIVDFGYSETFRKGRVECNAQTVRYVDRVILGAGVLDHQLMMPKALRYLLVEARGGNARLLSVRHDVSTYPVEWRGSLLCEEEPTLSRVWQLGAHTVQLCMEDIYTDTPRRERSGWLGDMLPEAMAAYYAFGETRLARHSLDLFMSSQQPEGYVSGRYPGRDLVNMPNFSAAYPQALADYVRHSGDVDFARQVWPGVNRLTEWFERHRMPDGLIVVMPSKQTDRDKVRHRGYILIDWAPEMRDGAVSVMNMCYYQHLRECAWLAGLLGESADAARYAALAERTRDATRRLLFDEERGFYVNCRDERGLSRQAGTQDNLLALLWDIATPEQTRRILPTLLPNDDAFPLYVNPDPKNWVEMGSGIVTWPHDSLVPIGSPYFFYFALGALFEIGRARAALNNIRKHYGGLLAEGATSVWEEWGGASSHSHGWGASPTVFAGKYLLGVEPVEPGFTGFRVLPSTGGLTRLSGRVPTPHGTISAAWERTDTGMTLRLTVPPGTRATAGLPEDAGRKLLCNGRECEAPQRLHLRRGVYLTCSLTHGDHELRLTAD